MIHVATLNDAALIAHLHDQARRGWPDFTPEDPEGVRSAIEDDGMVYLMLGNSGAVCLHADRAHHYGFMDFPYSSMAEAEVLLLSALDQLRGLRVECPLPVERKLESDLLTALGFRAGRMQRRMLLRKFPVFDIQLPPGADVIHPSHDELEALHDIVFPHFSKLAGWRTDPGLQPAIGLRWNGYLAGYVLTAFHASQHWLWELGVHPAHRRQGIGHTLTLLGLQQLQQLGAQEVHLLVNEDHDQNAPALYESVGFITQRHTIRYTKEQP